MNVRSTQPRLFIDPDPDSHSPRDATVLNARDAPGAAHSAADSGEEGAPTHTPAPSAAGASDQVLPVSRFSPSPGLVVDRTENSVVISGLMELSGPEASPSRAAAIQQAINTTWTRTFADGHSIVCAIAVKYRPPGSSPAEATQIEAAKSLGPSYVSSGLQGRSMTLNANEADAFTWAPAHEFGHVIGLSDRYSESILSEVLGSFGGARTTTAQPGYEGNLMAASGGGLSAQNVTDLAAENEPSPYWIHDDDQVAAWVSAHSTADIGKLSTTDKLRAIETLQGGWVSNDDMAAIGRVCASVTSHAEAEELRRGVNTLVFTDLGQRTQMRVFLSQMP